MALGPGSSVYIAWWEQFDLGPGQNPVSVIRIRRTPDGDPENLDPTTYYATPLFVVPRDAAASDACGRSAIHGFIRTNGFPALAVDRTSGAILLAYNALWVNGTSEVFFTRSLDGGATWSTPVQLNSDSAGDQFMPAIAVSPVNGWLKVIWYDRRRSPDNLDIGLYAITSTDGGSSFGSNVRLTSASFGVPQLCPTFDPDYGDCYWGDDIGLAGLATGAGFLHAWTDNLLKTTDPNNGPVPDPDIRAMVGC